MRRPAAAARPGRGAIRVPVAAQRRATLEKALRARANARKKRVDRLSRARAREGATRDGANEKARHRARRRRRWRASVGARVRSRAIRRRRATTTNANRATSDARGAMRARCGD